MQTSPVLTINENGSIYQSLEIRGNKSVYGFMKVSGRFNYVAITKVHANPFGGRIGKQFESFDQAQGNYKQTELKTMILLAETILK